MNRETRRQNRTRAMRTTVRKVQAEFNQNACSSSYSEELSHKLYAQQAYMARQIAEANYTEDAAKADAKELANAIANVDNWYLRSIIRELGRSRRYWHIACYEEMWSL